MNWLLRISDRRKRATAPGASTQKDTSVFDSRHVSTTRFARSMIDAGRVTVCGSYSYVAALTAAQQINGRIAQQDRSAEIFEISTQS